MAAETEGIALLSMYNDDEEEEDEEEEEKAPAPTPASEEHERGGAEEDGGVGASKDGNGAAQPPETPAPDATTPAQYARSPVLSEEESRYRTLRSPVSSQTPPHPPPPSVAQSLTPSMYSFHARSPTPPPFVPPPASVQESLEASWMRRGSLTIVDYGHDDVAMSPDHEEGEIESSGRVVVSMELQVSNGNPEDRTPPGNVQRLTPSTQAGPSQPSDFPEQSKFETTTAMGFAATEPEVAHVEVSAMESVEMQNDLDPLSSFLPLPVQTKCPEELQEKINKFLAYKRAGKSFNADLRNRKDYRNPDFLQHAVRYQDIDQIGTCFNKDVFDPHGYDKSDYYDEIETDMKREMERKEQERKKSQKVDFVSGGAQAGIVAPAFKISTQVPVTGVSAAATSILPVTSTVVTSTVDAMARDSRQLKKSKWDKIDGEIKNPLPSGGHDNLSTVGVHAAHLSAANAGAGYSAFAQQKRKEAEEKKSNERKSEKRS